MKSLLLGLTIAVAAVSGVWADYLTAFKVTCGQWLDTRAGRPESVELYRGG
jgi:hypothetical protein